MREIGKIALISLLLERGKMVGTHTTQIKNAARKTGGVSILRQRGNDHLRWKSQKFKETGFIVFHQATRSSQNVFAG